MALDAARYAVNDMQMKGKGNQASKILSSGELSRRGILINGSPAYEKFGIWWGRATGKVVNIK